MSRSALAIRPDFQRAEEHFRRCLDKLPVGAYICDHAGLITYFNTAAARTWGRLPNLNDPIDRFCGSFKLFAPDGSPLHHQDCWMGLALRNNREYIGEEILVERPDGSRITVLAHATPLHDELGQLTGAVNVLVDIDERHQAVEAIRQAHDAAEAMNRAKDRFLAALSHELRTPLSPVLMILGVMEADPELPERFRADINLIRRNVELETKLIDDLLDVSRAISGKLHLEKRPLSAHGKLRHVIQNCVSDVYSKRIHIDTDFSAFNDHFLGDPARFQQVFWNLLRNATKFTPEGGKITVRTSNDPATCDLRIEIIDNGIGIEKDALTRIFNPFEQGNPTTTREFGGMGLGLAIAKSIVEMHGGSISAESAGKGEGATFTVTIATLKDYVERNAGKNTVPAPTRAPTGARVLVVEDHADTALVLQRLLVRAGYEVKAARTVADALEFAATEKFDVLVSDIGLPDATGYDLMKQLKPCGIFGIAMSGYGMEQDIQRSRAAGFSEHLVKPIQINQLEALLDTVVRGE